MNPIAVTLLTGFLGAGKTTLLRHILNEQHGYKIAVIENEFGEVSVDDQLIGDRATQIKTLTNGCICCSRSNELEDALLDLLDNLDKGNIQFDRLVIECTGMADPGPIIQTFFSHEILCQRYLLDGVIALVDAVHADEQMNQFTIAQSQVGYADRILLTKTDVAGEAEKLRERLARINARAGDRATQIKTLTNGCICCSRSNELEDALLDLLDNLDKGNIQIDRLVIECTGMADPGPIIQTFFSHEMLCQRYLLDGVIALVDAVHADEQMNQFTIAQSQVGYADRILLTKTDVAGEAEKLRERLARINARAPVYTVTHGDIDLGLLVGYADRILLTKTDVAGEAEKLRERLARINARAPVYTVTHGDIDLGLLFWITR